MTTVRLRHLAKVNPPTPAFDRLRADDEITFLPMEAVWPGQRLDLTRRSTKAAVATGYTRFQDGDVLVPKITPTFEAARAVLVDGLHRGVGAGTTELHVLRPGPRIDPRFLLYVVNTHSFLKLGEAEMYGVAGQQRVPDDFLRNLPVALPTLEEQRRIADFLDAEAARLDSITTHRASQVAALREREMSVIYSHIAGTLERGERKSTGWSWIQSTPSHWRIAPVYSVYDVQLGKMLNTERTSGDHLKPYLRNANIGWYSINTSHLAVMNFPPNERRRYRVRAGDLLVCEGGAGVAEAAVWDAPGVEVFYQKSLHRVRARQDVPVEWLMYWLRIAKHMGLFASEGNIATIPHLTGEQLRESRIPVPPDSRDRVRKISAAVEHIHRLIKILQSADQLLNENRKALITAAVTGQIDVTTARGVDAV
ncbi:restriction endonuclease subunit S [Streptomyces sp. NPDC059558]|uniref:restriction endonuclease subunit S n=1 Tax=Streptomyces sp. NPDC059558 TaxID=3346864 RepID=UPI0036BF6C90